MVACLHGVFPPGAFTPPPTTPLFTSTWPHVRSDFGLEEGQYLKKLSLCYSVVYCYNDAQRYEQFLQVGRLYQALILLSLDFYLASASVSLVFMVLSLSIYI